MIYFYWSAEYIVTFIEILMSFVFCNAFFKSKDIYGKHFALLLSAVIAILSLGLGNIKLFSAFNTVFVFFILVVTHKHFFHVKLLKAFGVELSYYAVLFVCDLITSALVAVITHSTISNLFNEFSNGRVLGSLSSKLILVVICIVFNKLSYKDRSNNKKSTAIISAVSIIILLTCTALYFEQSKSQSDDINLMITIFFIVILILVITLYACVIYFFTAQENKREYELADQQKNLLSRSLKEQEHTFTLWRKNIHDYKNTILALDSMIEKHQYDELAMYVAEQKDVFTHKAEYIHTGNNTVDTVINTKYAVAKDKGISYTVNAVMPESCRVSDIHLATILGNLIDNALEASEKENDPYIDIKIITEKSFLLISVINNCTNSNPIDKTSKSDKDKHGIGLKSVKTTVEEYDGTFSLTFEDDQAEASIMIQI
ncbi:GHKL domain-containing protein [bacterium]|nr:GHKL domain-containing protein [bacterium]